MQYENLKHFIHQLTILYAFSCLFNDAWKDVSTLKVEVMQSALNQFLLLISLEYGGAYGYLSWFGLGVIMYRTFVLDFLFYLVASPLCLFYYTYWIWREKNRQLKI